MDSKPKMSIRDTWLTLGCNPDVVFRNLASVPLRDRAACVERAYEQAKKLSKAQFLLHHPDKGGDPEKFRKVKEAIDSLEIYTQEFKRKMEDRIKEIEEKSRNRVIIEIK